MTRVEVENFYFFSTKQDVVTACYSEIYNSTPFPNQSITNNYIINYINYIMNYSNYINYINCINISSFKNNSIIIKNVSSAHKNFCKVHLDMYSYQTYFYQQNLFISHIYCIYTSLSHIYIKFVKIDLNIKSKL